MPMTIGVPREVHPGERRVAATPDSVKELLKLGYQVVVETGAGQEAFLWTAEAGMDGAAGDRFSFGDYDGDGDADLLVDGSRLWRNDSKGKEIRLADVTVASGMGAAKGGGACWVDVDGDGDLEVVAREAGVDAYRYAVMARRRDGAWEEVFAGGGGGCGRLSD